MSDLIRLLMEIVQLVWPLRIVHEWEIGGYYVAGHFWKEVGPGVYPVLPWFMDVKTLSKAEAIFGTGRQDITLSDARVLSFAATAKGRIVNGALALNSIDDVQSSAQEILASVLADELATEDASRLSPEARRRLLRKLRTKVNEEANLHGLEISAVRFTSFVINPKLIRLLVDQMPISSW